MDEVRIQLKTAKDLNAKLNSDIQGRLEHARQLNAQAQIRVGQSSTATEVILQF